MGVNLYSAMLTDSKNVIPIVETTGNLIKHSADKRAEYNLW